MKKNKKAISPIISTVLLISIIVIIGVLIYNFSINFFEKQKTETSGLSAYYDVELSILMDLGSVSLNGIGDGNPLILGVRRIDNQDSTNWTTQEKENNLIKGIRFNFEDNQGNSYSYDTYSFPPIRAGFTYSYEVALSDSKASSWNDLTKISIMLIYGQNKVTEVLDEIFIE
jgi:flagellin-like protein